MRPASPCGTPPVPISRSTLPSRRPAMSAPARSPPARSRTCAPSGANLGYQSACRGRSRTKTTRSRTCLPLARATSASVHAAGASRHSGTNAAATSSLTTIFSMYATRGSGWRRAAPRPGPIARPDIRRPASRLPFERIGQHIHRRAAAGAQMLASDEGEPATPGGSPRSGTRRHRSGFFAAPGSSPRRRHARPHSGPPGLPSGRQPTRPPRWHAPDPVRYWVISRVAVHSLASSRLAASQATMPPFNAATFGWPAASSAAAARAAPAAATDQHHRPVARDLVEIGQQAGQRDAAGCRARGPGLNSRGSRTSMTTGGVPLRSACHSAGRLDQRRRAPRAIARCTRRQLAMELLGQVLALPEGAHRALIDADRRVEHVMKEIADSRILSQQVIRAPGAPESRTRSSPAAPADAPATGRHRHPARGRRARWLPTRGCR